jgi:hypothetical protein
LAPSEARDILKAIGTPQADDAPRAQSAEVLCMRTRLRFVLVGCSALLCAWVPGLEDATAQDRSGKPSTKPEDRILEIQKLLESPVEIKGFPEEIPLAKFFAALEALLHEGKKVSFRINEEAFGPQLPRVMGAMVRCPHEKNVTLVSVLRRALAEVSAERAH